MAIPIVTSRSITSAWPCTPIASFSRCRPERVERETATLMKPSALASFLGAFFVFFAARRAAIGTPGVFTSIREQALDLGALLEQPGNEFLDAVRHHAAADRGDADRARRHAARVEHRDRDGPHARGDLPVRHGVS